MTTELKGQFVPRLEDERFLTGRGAYIDDAPPPPLHVAVVRSEHAHARIDAMDITAAAASEDVVGVHTASDLLADGIAPLPCVATFEAVYPLKIPPRHALALERVRHVGDPVAFIVARTPQAALAAAEKVDIDYTPLECVVDGAAALDEGAAQLWTQAPGNLAFEFEAGQREATSAALQAAEHVVEIELVNQRVSALPLETRAGEASYDAGTGHWHLHCNAQGVHGVRNQLAQHVFKVPPEQLRVTAPDVGGGFGLKNFVYPEWVMLLWAARRHGQTVRWSASRSEDFLSAAYGRDMRVHARLGLDGGGRMLALEAHAVANMGAYLSGSGPAISTRAMPTAMGGVYAIPQVYLNSRGAFSNTVPVDAYRGAGKPEANYLVERLVDKAARECGFDPFELRRINTFRQFPHVTAMGHSIDCGAFGANIDRAEALAARDGLQQRRAQAAARGKLFGQGVACFLETSRGAPEEGAEVLCLDDGTIELRLGTESQGQGHETAFAQIAADQLQLPMTRFRYVQADTARIRMGHGHGGARTMHMGGMALTQAIDKLLLRARDVAAGLLQGRADALRYADGEFHLDSASVTLAAAAEAAARDGGAGLSAFASHHDTPFTFPNGCHVAEVEVDPETGVVRLCRYLAIDDYGNLVNPVLTQAQVAGGVTQGIGQAMGEFSVYEADSGQLLVASLMDYGAPHAGDVPDFEIELNGVATAANPLGVKGSGQAGCIAAPQTVVHAVLDALAPLGVRHLDMPLTPQSVWQAIRSSQI